MRTTKHEIYNKWCMCMQCVFSCESSTHVMSICVWTYVHTCCTYMRRPDQRVVRNQRHDNADWLNSAGRRRACCPSIVWCAVIARICPRVRCILSASVCTRMIALCVSVCSMAFVNSTVVCACAYSLSSVLSWRWWWIIKVHTHTCSNIFHASFACEIQWAIVSVCEL